MPPATSPATPSLSTGGGPRADRSPWGPEGGEGDRGTDIWAPARRARIGHLSHSGSQPFAERSRTNASPVPSDSTPRLRTYVRARQEQQRKDGGGRGERRLRGTAYRHRLRRTAGARRGEPSAERLGGEITELAAHLSAGTCRFLAGSRVRPPPGVGGVGRCSLMCGVDRLALRDRPPGPPASRPGWRGPSPIIRKSTRPSPGDSSPTRKVRALTRMGGAYSESDLMNLARQATAAQLERISRSMRPVSTAEANDTHEGRYLSTVWEDDGSLSIHGNLPAEDGALLLRALDRARDALWEPCAEGGGSAEPRAVKGHRGSAEPTAPGGRSRWAEPRRITNADALAAMAERSLSGGSGRSTAADRYQVIVHVDEGALTGSPPPSIEGGPSVRRAPPLPRRSSQSSLGTRWADQALGPRPSMPASRSAPTSASAGPASGSRSLGRCRAALPLEG
jgi:hypothetical protein